ncbi:MAG TPA: glycosyltransferase [Tepidisphaeraceae bacterium]|nr:glycosyltransferase [Tepidisphaeraceae bacterium]
MINRRIKLVIVIVDLAAGTGSFVRSLGSGLRRWYSSEFEVHLLTIRSCELSDADRAAFDQAHSLDMDLKENWRQMFALPIAVKRMRMVLEEVQPDLIMGVHTFSNVVSSFAAGDRPVILTDHLNLSQRQSARGFSAPTRMLMKQMYRKHLAVGVCQEIVNDLRAHFDASRTEAILNGVDVTKIRAASTESPRIEVPSRYIIAVGRLAPQKDIPTLLQAYALARKAGLHEDLVIVGDGPERASLVELSRSSGLENHVHFAGQQANPFPLIARSKMLVMSSVYEGFGLVLAEALALGVPCVSTDCPSGPREILGNGQYGLLVPVRDPQRLADAMFRLANDDELRKQFIARSGVRANELSLENMTRRYRDLMVKELQSSSPV